MTRFFFTCKHFIFTFKSHFLGENMKFCRFFCHQATVVLRVAASTKSLWNRAQNFAKSLVCKWTIWQIIKGCDSRNACETLKSYPGSLFQELPGLESYKIRQIVHLNTKQEYLTVCFDFCCVCLHRFSTIFDEFAIEITFEVAISTSEVMQNHLSSLKIEFNALISS